MTAFLVAFLVCYSVGITACVFHLLNERDKDWRDKHTRHQR